MKDLYAAQIAKVLTELGQRSSSLHAIQQRAGVAIRGATMADPVATRLGRLLPPVLRRGGVDDRGTVSQHDGQGIGMIRARVKNERSRAGQPAG